MKKKLAPRTAEPAEGQMEAPPVVPVYQTVGRCGFCLAPIECLQPGGSGGRHVESKVPYGLCEQARKRAGEA